MAKKINSKNNYQHNKVTRMKIEAWLKQLKSRKQRGA